MKERLGGIIVCVEASVLGIPAKASRDRDMHLQRAEKSLAWCPARPPAQFSKSTPYGMSRDSYQENTFDSEISENSA